MDPPNTTQRDRIFEWKKNAMQRSCQAGQRYNKHVRKINKHVPRSKMRCYATKPNNGDAGKNLAYQEDVRLNSLISNLAQRSTEFGITMEKEDDISDGLVEAVPNGNVSDLALLGMSREAAVMSPEVVGCVTINGFAFRTFPTDGNNDIAGTWDIKSELDEDVKPNIDEMDKILFPTKTTDITKIKGWRNKAFAENDKFIVKQESEENWDASNELVEQSKSVDSTPSAASINHAKDSTLLCALTLSYTKPKSTVPQQNQQPKKSGQNLSPLKERVVSTTPLTSHPVIQKSVVQPAPAKPAIQMPTIQPVAINTAKKPKTKAEYRRMLEDAARSHDIEVPVIPPAPVARCKPGPVPKWQGNATNPTVQQAETFEHASMEFHQEAGRVDRRLKGYRKLEAVRCQMAKQLALDSRYMYALVDGRPIKIGGSALAKKMAEMKRAKAEKPAKAEKIVKITPPKPIDPRYTSLLKLPDRPVEPLSAPRVKRRNRGKPLSKKLEARSKRLGEFCLRLHPAVGFPLTDAAFQQVSLLRDDQMDVSDDWIKFATSVVNSNRKDSRRKGFVEKVIKTADILLPVRVTRSGKRYEAGNMENFNTINVPDTEADKVVDNYTYQNCAEVAEDIDAPDSEIKSLLRSMVDSVAKQEAIEGLLLQAEPKHPSLEHHDFLNPSRATAANPRKRRSALNIELRRLNVLVIEEREAEAEEKPKEPAEAVDAPACKKEFCKLGCLCVSIERPGVDSGHCGLAECMFECVCPLTGVEERSALPKSVVSKIAESTKYLARTEKEFQRAVVCNKDEILVVDGCAAPATGRRKREVKLPVRFRESGIDDKMLFGGNANLEVMEARKQEKMAEDPRIENIEGKMVAATDPNEHPMFGIGGCPLFVPNHVKTPEFFLHRLKGRALEKKYAQQYRLKTCNVVMFRAKLDNVQPFCIVHDKYTCSCLSFLNPDGALTVNSHRQPFSVRRPFFNPSSKRRNVAVKKTAPRFLPTSGLRREWSRTESTPEHFLSRPRDKESLQLRQNSFRARLHGEDKSVTIPGSQILPNVVQSSDSLEARVVDGPTAERFAVPKDNCHGVKPSDSELVYQMVCKALLTPSQPKQPKETPAKEFPVIMRGSTKVSVPPNCETKMMLWGLLQDSFLNNSLQMWLSSPEIGSPKLYVSSNVKAPDVKCRNLRNWSGKTVHGYPPLVAELMKQIPEESAGDMVRFGVLLKHKDHWEVLGITKLHRATQGNLSDGSRNVKFLKDNAIMSVPLPAIRTACRWHVIYIDCHFDRIVFQGCVIIEKHIIQLRDGSQNKNCVNAILFHDNFEAQFKSLDLLPMFGLYALPKIQECVFLGPFGLENSKGDVVSMFKDVTGKGKDSTTGRIFVEVIQPKSRSTWLFAEGLSQTETTNYIGTLKEKLITDREADSLVVKTVVAPQEDNATTIAKESVIRKNTSAAVEHYNKNPMEIAASIKNRLISSSLQRSRLGSIAAKKVAASKAYTRRPQFVTAKPAAFKPQIPAGLIKQTALMSILKTPPLIPQDSSIFPLPVECVVEEVATSSAEIVESLPTRSEETVKSPPIKSGVRISSPLSPPSIDSQFDFSPFEEQATRAKSPVEDLEAALKRLQSFDTHVPQPLTETIPERRSSVTFPQRRSPSLDHEILSPSRPVSGASNHGSVSVTAGCSSTRASGPSNGGGVSTITKAFANRPGLTISGQSSVMTSAALPRSVFCGGSDKVTEVVLSDDDDKKEALEEDADIMVVPRTWQPGTVPPDLPADYEPAEINTRSSVGEMFAAAVEGSTHVKYVPSIPSLGYVEGYRLPDNRTCIRFFEKPLLEVTICTSTILAYLDKHIRTSPLLRVVPPDLPLTWQFTEDMDSFPDVLPFNYAQTFDGNHMLCEKGLLCKKVRKEMVSKSYAQEEDVVALQRLKKIVGVPDIPEVLLEEIISQVAGEILQCQRLEQDLEYKRLWWTRRRRKTRKRLIRRIMAQPSKEEQRLLIETMELICKSSSKPNVDPDVQIVDESDEGAGNVPGDDQRPEPSGPRLSLSGWTPRRLECKLFPVDMCATQPSGVSGVRKQYSEKKALRNLPSLLPTRSPESLLRKNLLGTVGPAVIPLMDLTDDSAPPTLVLQPRPELPVVDLADEDDNQGASRPASSDNQGASRPASSVSVPKPATADKLQIGYSYGVNSAGHFFRCATINNRIVNKVRITKVPANVECLRMIEQPNPTTVQTRVAGNGAAANAVMASGTQKFGVRLANARVQGSQVLPTEYIVVGSTKSNVNQNLGQKIGLVPVSGRLVNSSQATSSGQQIVGHKPGAAATIRIPNEWLQLNSQASQKEVTMAAQASNARKTVGQLVGTVPKEVQLGKTTGTAANCSRVAEVTILNGNVQIAGNPDDTKGVREVVDKLISSGKFTGNTRQIMIKGPILASSPNILKRQVQLPNGTTRDLHVHIQATQESVLAKGPMSTNVHKRPFILPKRKNSMINVGNGGKFVKIKLPTATTQAKSKTEIAAQSPGSQLGDNLATGAVAVKLASKPVILVDAQMQIPIAVAKAASKSAILVDAPMEMPIAMPEDPSESASRMPIAVAVKVASESEISDTIPIVLPAAVVTADNSENDLVIDTRLHSPTSHNSHEGDPETGVLQIEESLD